MSAVESSSYMAYLRDVARSTNASIAASVFAKARTQHPHRKRTPAKAIVEDDTSYRSDDDVEVSYDYDYLREPPSGFLCGYRSSGGRREPPRKSAVRLHTTSSTTCQSITKATDTKGERKNSLQVSFEEMYASLKELGRREMGAAMAFRHTTQQFYPSSPSCSPHSPPPTTSRKHVHATSSDRQDRRMQIRACDAHRSLSPSSERFQHSWSGSHLAIRVPPLPLDDEERSGVEKLSGKQSVGTACTIATTPEAKMLASTDTSAITASSAKLTSSPSDTSSCSTADENTHSALRPQHRLRCVSARRLAGFSCPYCCRRCDSCKCIGRPCQRNNSSETRRHAADKRVPDASSPCRSGSDATRMKSSPKPSGRNASPLLSFGGDTVRLKWPNRPKAHESRLVPTTPTRAASPTHQRPGSAHRHRKVKWREECQEKEAVLREIAQRTCTCYWSEFPDLTMAINPSSHAVRCAYQAQHALHDELMFGLNDDDERMETGSCSNSASLHSSENASRPSAALRNTCRKRKTAAEKNAPATTAAATAAFSVRAAVNSAFTHEAEFQRLREQRRRWLADEDAATKKETHGRAAVIGTAKRCTYMEQIMSAARDAPYPTKPTTTSTRSKPQQQKDGQSPSPTSIVDVTVTPRTAPPPPPPLLPETSLTDEPQFPTERESNESTKSSLKETNADKNNREEEKVEPEKVTEVTPDVAHDEQTFMEEEQPLFVDVVEDGNRDITNIEAVAQPASMPVIEEPSESEKEEDPLCALSRPRQRPAVGVPGPGAYYVDEACMWSSSVHGVHGAAMSKATRMPPMKSITPGPGAYNVYGDNHSKEYRVNEKSKKEKVLSEEANEENYAAEGKAEDVDGAVASETKQQPSTIGKGVVFSSTSARQFLLQFGSPYQRSATWAKRVAALPGPGAYNIVDGDRIDQSRPLGTAKLGFHFTKSSDGAHYTGFIHAGEEPRTTTTNSAEGAVPVQRRKLSTTAGFVVPWQDWAGGAYIGTSTTAFWAHPSLAGGGRRVLPRRGKETEEIEEPSLFTAGGAAAAAARKNEGGAWHGVGSGVALRLTSLRFPDQSSSASAVHNNADEDNTKKVTASELLHPGGGEPGPGSYETEAALRFIQKRAPEVSMTFKHDRGPRGPLQSTAVTAAPVSVMNEENAPLPGPGTYEVVVSDAWGPRRSPQWQFGTAARMPYDSASSAVIAATTSAIDVAYGSHEGEQVPGPGAYSVDAAYHAVQPSAASAVMGIAPRFQDEPRISKTLDGAVAYGEESLVGPGTYNVNAAYEKLHGRVRGGALPRAAARTRDLKGGNNSFQNGDKIANDGATIGAYGDETVPGPGTYILPPLPATGPTAILGTSAPRFPWERMELAKESLGLPNDMSFTFMSGLTPGPGAYDVDAAAHLASRPGTVIGRAPRSTFLVSTGDGSTSREVGPGSYYLPPLPAGRSVVMPYSHSSEPARAELYGKGLPGPGLYDPVDVGAPAPRTFTLARTSARFDAGTSAAEAPKEDVISGPGAYEMEGQTAQGGVVFGTAARFINSSDVACAADHHNIVGPGYYDPYVASPSAFAFSFPRSRRFAAGGGNSHDDAGGGGEGVGPGAYEVVDLSPPGRSAIMGSAVARPFLPNNDAAWRVNGNHANSSSGDTFVPGPGTYSPQYAQVMKSAPQVALARVGHDAAGSGVNRDAGSGLGPGQYDPQYPSDAQQYAHGHTFSLAPRTVNSSGAGVDGNKEEVPGPGAYEVRTTRDGQLLDNASSGGFPFSTAPRLAGNAGLNETSLSPGADAPGPGSYMPEAYTDMGSGYGGAAAVSARMGTAPRTLIGEEEAKAAAGPGPGAYEPNPYAALIAAPSITFPRAESRTALDKTDTPGPGAYTPNSKHISMLNAAGERATHIGTAQRFPQSAGVSSNDDDGVSATPGPNSYAPVDTAVRATAPSHRFGTAPAHGDGVVFGDSANYGEGPSATSFMVASKGIVPGPGSYDVDRADRWVQNAGGTAAAYRFGTAARFENGSNAEAVDAAGVGPGAYDVSSGLARTSQIPTPASYSFPRAPPHASAAADQGDGAGETLAPTAADGSPGPGAYELPPSFPGGPQWGFGTAPKLAYENSGRGGETNSSPPATAVGPGSYAVPPPPPLHGGITVPRASMRFVSNENGASPGPGVYDVTEAYNSLSTTGAAAGGVRIGTASRYPAETHVDGFGDARYGPGPGAYSPNIDASSATARVGPTFPHAARMPTDADHRNGVDSDGARLVGPGSYDLSSTLTAFASAPRFGTAPRVASASANGAAGNQTGQDVGPGTYFIDRADVQVLPRAPSHHIIASREYESGSNGRDTASKAELPGPGSYDVPVEVQHHARAALLLGRAADSADAAARQQTPGCGAYDLSQVGSISAAGAAAHRFGTAPTHRLPPTSGNAAEGAKEPNSDVSPGPGTYDSAAAFRATQTKGPSHGFTMQGRPVDRALEKRGEEPGPGAYHATDDFHNGTAPSYRFGTALRMPATSSEHEESVLGPGAYDTSICGTRGQSTGPSLRFTQAPRMENFEKNNGVAQNPGPGAYDVEHAQQNGAPSFTIPRAPRPALCTGNVEASPMVGPGSYTPTNRFAKGEGSAPTIGQAQRVWDAGSEDTPGPGSYSLQRTTASAAGAPSFGTSQRPDPAAGRCDTPGPGTYSTVSGYMAGLSGPSFSTAGRHVPEVDDRPGPGTYDDTHATFGSTSHRHGEGPSATTFSLAERVPFVLDDNPGPGAYFVHLAPSGPAVSFGFGERTSTILHDTPGPGTYDTEFSAPVGFASSFGYGERPNPVINTNPGPGTYRSMYSPPAGPAAGFGYGERPNPVTNGNPGPGTYSVYSAPDGRASSFGYGQRPSPVISTNPGPGAYHREAYIAQLTDAPPGVGFGMAERPSPTLNNNPGPGAYHREKARETYLPTFGLAERPNAVLNTNPGPGTYYKDDYLAAGVKVPWGISFGTSERPNAVLNTNPGPGTYYRESNRSHGVEGSGECSFGKAERPSPTRSDTPGPGTYFRGDAERSAAAPARVGVSLGAGGGPRREAQLRPATPATDETEAGNARSENAQRKQRRRPTAADTLAKLASVGYPLDKKP